MELVDTHCHLDLKDFDRDRDAVIARAHAVGVEQIIVPGVEAQTWDQLVSLCRATPGLHPALGLHPVYLERHCKKDLHTLSEAVKKYNPVAVGEIGLDFYSGNVDRNEQQELFEAQLEIAKAAHLPVILHVRKAHDQVIKTLKQFTVVGGIVHAFNGSIEQAGQYQNLGFKLGFGGMLTFERSRKIRALASKLPVQAVVLETDAPDMTVASHQGERNSPEYLPECLHALAEVRQQDPLFLAAQCTRNARDVLNLAQ